MRSEYPLLPGVRVAELEQFLRPPRGLGHDPGGAVELGVRHRRDLDMDHVGVLDRLGSGHEGRPFVRLVRLPQGR